jgi:Tfp pilus assembly ATPase PilU
MSDVQPYSFGQSPTREARRAARAISRHAAQNQVRISAADDEVDLAIAKAEGYTQYTGRAMHRALEVALVQRWIEQQVPEKAGDLALLAAMHTAGLAEFQDDLRRTLRRA